ncbi:MAG: tRNA (guanosine(37)-N1)-methyltransferase TrmD [Gammaproteobacteria bacterium]|nr:MAG: tRNA (guanosine(37)-N1)-methyltransferase TrmD [Gammaproteobacteria bacterium]
MRIDVVTLFPEMIRDCCRYGIPRIAMEKGLLELESWNPRDFADNRHRRVDDRPYGGGPGMVMQVQPVADAIKAARGRGEGLVIYLSPQGKRLDQAALQRFVELPHMILLAGRYEGIDERLIELHVDEEWSIGDYVLSGGEPAALVWIDALARLLPGALGDEESALYDSFMDGLLDYPHYSRPEVVDGIAVPDVLLSGNHADIERWRMKQSLGRTWQRRPDLLEQKVLSEEQQALLTEFIREQQSNEPDRTRR